MDQRRLIIAVKNHFNGIRPAPPKLTKRGTNIVYFLVEVHHTNYDIFLPK